MQKPKITIIKDGPYVVTGNVPLCKEIIVVDKEHSPLTWKKGMCYPKKQSYSLCSCGKSGEKPYCDGTHSKIRYKGKETANRELFLKQAHKIDGPNLVLRDVPKLCASAAFCERLGGTWNLVERSNDDAARKAAIQQACDCPSGRLVAFHKKTGKEIEPEFKPSISLVEDPDAGFSGPIWVKGRIPIFAADGTKYEVRNRVTLCRCGKSKNKPFCDSRHISAGFSGEK